MQRLCSLCLITLCMFTFCVGFEGVDDFFAHLRDHILERLETKGNCDRTPPTPQPVPTTTPTTADRTATTNAANLKASQKFILDQSCVIDCSVNNSADTSSFVTSKQHGPRSGSELKEEGAVHKKKEPFTAHLKPNNSHSPH